MREKIRTHEKVVAIKNGKEVMKKRGNLWKWFSSFLKNLLTT